VDPPPPESVHDVVPFTVGCASASSDWKIAGRQITANTKAQQRDFDMLTTLMYMNSTDHDKFAGSADFIDHVYARAQSINDA